MTRAGVRPAATEDVATVERETHRQQHDRERERHRGERQQVTRLPVARFRPEPVEGEIEDAAGEPVVDESDEQPGDEEPDRDHDSRPRGIVGERGRLRAEQRQCDTDEEGDRGDRVLAILGGLSTVIAQLRENRPWCLRDEQDSLPPRAGFVRARPLSLDGHAGSVWDGAPTSGNNRFQRKTF